MYATFVSVTVPFAVISACLRLPVDCSQIGIDVEGSTNLGIGPTNAAAGRSPDDINTDRFHLLFGTALVLTSWAVVLAPASTLAPAPVLALALSPVLALLLALALTRDPRQWSRSWPWPWYCLQLSLPLPLSLSCTPVLLSSCSRPQCPLAHLLTPNSDRKHCSFACWLKQGTDYTRVELNQAIGHGAGRFHNVYSRLCVSCCLLFDGLTRTNLTFADLT